MVEIRASKKKIEIISNVTNVMDRFTLYASPYLVVSPRGYTKHYYAGSSRVSSQLGTGVFNEINYGYNTYGHFTLYDKTNMLSNKLQRSCTDYDVMSQIFILEYLWDYRWNPPPTLGTVGETYFYHTDHLGSSSWITDRGGNPMQYLRYLPYGEQQIDQRATGWNTQYIFSGKEKDEETGYSYFGARYYLDDLSIWLSVDPLADKYPWISPYAYCNNNPVRYIDPDGRDWYEAEGGKVTWTDHTNKKDFAKSGIKGAYLGKTHTDSKGNYYSLFGQTMKANSRNGKATQKIDDAFIKYAKYLEDFKTGGSSNSPYDAEWHDPIQTSTDFSNIIPFNDRWGTTSENIHGPDQMGRYADIADINMFVTGARMDGKFDSFSAGMKESTITGNNGNFAMSGYFLKIANTKGRVDNIIVALRFGNAANVKSFQNKFFKLFPNAK